MEATRVSLATPPDPAAAPASARLGFMDNLRYLMVVLVVLFHSVGAYAAVAPHWPVHDSAVLWASVLREFLDVFLMPVLFFAAGYFALPSLLKHGQREFLKDKVVRLLVPWALAVFVVLPLALYDTPVKPVRPFWRYWLNYMGSFRTGLRPSETPLGITTQAVYWFISLLFAFFVGFALIQLASRRMRGGTAAPVERPPASRRSVLAALLAFGAMTSAAYLALLLAVPDSSWFTLSAFLEFQVTRLVPYLGCFALGVYAQSHGWFAERRPLSSPKLLGALGVVLSAAYLWFGRPMLLDTSGTAGFSVGYLLAFAILRSFLLLTLLVFLVSFGIAHWNRTSRLDRQLASVSYDVYLVHFLIVVALQTALMKWAGGPVAAKVAIVFAIALGLSFALSRWVLARHGRAFAIAILALFVFCLVVRP
jgi:glucans biosynthesis protein C